MVTEAGLMVKGDMGGKIQICAEAVSALLATLVAVRVTDCTESTDDGGVYSPVLSTLPKAGLIDQVTELLAVPAGRTNWA
jgi:hypothetical protein